ncbi:hypothetical protein FACS1894120_6060 [Clostridia bacterium]|nr:hypothetical protein FACS1894120_6060 [Clostridia bacterium]
MKEKQAEYLERLFAELTGEGLKAEIVPGMGRWQIGDTLRMLMPVGVKGEEVLLEIAAARFDDDLSFISLYSAIIPETKNTGVSLHQLNLICPIGAFGVAGNQVYHKYSLIFDDYSDVDLLIYDTVRALAGISYIIAVHLPELLKAFL